MVAFPESPTEPALSNMTIINLNDCTDCNEHLVNKANDRGVKDHVLTIEGDNVSNGKDNYALDIDNIEKDIDNKLNASADIKAEPDVVKKVAGKNLYTYCDTYSIDVKKMQKENRWRFNSYICYCTFECLKYYVIFQNVKKARAVQLL